MEKKNKDIGRKIWLGIIIFTWVYFCIGVWSVIGICLIRLHLNSTCFIEKDISYALVFLLVTNVFNTFVYKHTYKK